jgi:hypothetical protein
MGYEWLRPLADLLIARHVSASLPDHELRRSMLAEAGSTWQRSERRLRSVAVVGAGASAPVLERGDDLAQSLIKQFDIDESAVQAERERLKRITAVNPWEFEAQLAAIGQTLGGDRRVRTAISELYRVRHPTVKAYELIAHLVKHRFLDAVITMNFDELLDQSLDDELGIGEYQRIVSDRDCVDIQTNSQAPDYIPLYIKLHGTASEPESLRFTRESYYDSPVRVGTVAAELFRVPECVVVNVGFGMGSFDLHRLLAMPERLWLFNLSRENLEKDAKEAIALERHERGKSKPKFLPKKKDHPGELSDRQLEVLLGKVEKRAGRLLEVAPSVISIRSVKRHDAVVQLLGPASGAGRRLAELPRTLDDARFSVDLHVRAAKPNATYAGYLRRRAILELALALARGRGLVSVGALAVDRGGHYFDAYRRYASENPSSWRDLYTLVGFEQNEKVPDVFIATPEICRGRKRKKGETWRDLPKLDLPRLAERVLPHVVDSPTDQDFEILVEAMRRLYRGTEYEIHSRDDRVCAKTFSEPITLKTISALDAYSFDLIREAGQCGKDSEVDIISETGDWLLEQSGRLPEYVARIGRVRLIVAFTTVVPKLQKRFPRLKPTQQQPWHHNRHMVIVKYKGEPRRALYYARHHRTPYVTPVLVCRRRDIEVLQTTFKDRWRNSSSV